MLQLYPHSYTGREEGAHREQKSLPIGANPHPLTQNPVLTAESYEVSDTLVDAH